MKRVFKISIYSFFLLLIIAFIISCKKESNDNQNNKKTGDTGQVVFWVADDIGYVSINVDGTSEGSIKGYYYGGEPACGDSKCLTLTLKGGTHNYTATGNLGTISNSFTVISNTCNSVKVYGDR
jgi:hypothetical protein